MQKSWADARNYCCSIGMDLASVHLIEKRECIANIFNKLPLRLNATSYWSSGRATKIPGKHFWCSTESYFYQRETVWAENYPKNEHTCVVISFNKTSNNTDLKTAFCEEEKHFLCAAFTFHQPKGNKAQRMFWDCKRTYDIGPLEEDNLLAFSMTPPRLNLMCFARCMGQYHRKILDTSANENSILRGLEDLQMSPTEVQTIYAVLEKCDLATAKMNYSRCEFTYMIAKCALISSYQTLLKTITLLTGNYNDVLPTTLPCEPNYQYCNVDYQCGQNAALIGQLKTTGKTDVGKSVSAQWS
ncbi:uncharacterized protein LOC132202112 isoform X3 [Neocloeon triangulifer]|uniref:uncharacterized protein LOC132202112 isoform X3 n=1 Tax=Neocloeon triangulifer TaxID=2078957 RepID=UPI00286EEBA1|nr:uncharacterized protein LOC132202112 isoform X3 [Neocloeon triangulifer]